METVNTEASNSSYMSCCKCNGNHPSLIISLDRDSILLEEYTCEYCNDLDGEYESTYIGNKFWEYNEYWYDDEYDSDDFYDEAESDYFLKLEDEYEFRCSVKGERGSRATAIKAKHASKAKRKPVKSCIANKRSLRLEEKHEQLKARKARLQERSYLSSERYCLAHGHYASSRSSKIKSQAQACSTSPRHPKNKQTFNKSTNGYSASVYTQSYYKPESVLSAQELGIETGAMYDRLMEIMNGGNITPEDFDLLLQLDETNTKKTLDSNVLKEFDVVTVGVGLNSIPVDARCTICLDPFKDMRSEAELRRLPCGHMFCKECIDAWLSNMSSKCPELSCYWSKDSAIDTRPSELQQRFDFIAC